jgi:hypothetical protein
METSRTFSNVLEKFQKKRKDLVANLIETKSKLLIIELGAGTTVPSVRIASETMFNDKRWIAHLVRINSFTEHSIINESYKNKSNKLTFELSMDALTALTLIDEAVKNQLSIK